MIYLQNRLKTEPYYILVVFLVFLGTRSICFMYIFSFVSSALTLQHTKLARAKQGKPRDLNNIRKPYEDNSLNSGTFQEIILLQSIYVHNVKSYIVL